MHKIHSLSDKNLLAISCRNGVPSDDRMVILHDLDVQQGALVRSARYKDGRWIEAATDRDVTDQLTSSAIWSEMLLFPEKCCASLESFVAG